MTTRTDPPTADDIAGRTERGQAAYNERRSQLAEKGIAIPDLYDQDQLDDDSDPTGSQRFWRRMAAETAASVDQEREWSRQDEHANDRKPHAGTNESRVIRPD